MLGGVQTTITKGPAVRLSTFAIIAGATSALYAGSASAYLISTTTTGTSNGSPSQPTYQTSIAKPVNPALDPGTDSFTMTWKVPAGTSTSGGVPNPDLTAEATFKVTTFNATTLAFDIGIKNTTVLPAGNFNTNILSFGFGITPDATGVTVADGNLDPVTWEGEIQTGQQQFPGGFKLIDVCVWAANGCSGGNVNQGLAAGASDKLTLTLTGDFAAPTGSANLYVAQLSDFPLKFQGTWGSFEVPGVPGGGGGCTNPNGCNGGGGGVPEPTSIALFGLGMVALRLNQRRRPA